MIFTCDLLRSFPGLTALCKFCRYVILPKDFEKAYKTAVKKSDSEFEFYR